MAVEQHLDALPAEEYQITVSQTKDGQLQTERFHGTRAQVIGSLEMMKTQHAQGADITMRPLDSRYALAHNLNKDEVDFYLSCAIRVDEIARDFVRQGLSRTEGAPAGASSVRIMPLACKRSREIASCYRTA